MKLDLKQANWGKDHGTAGSVEPELGVEIIIEFEDEKVQEEVP